MSSRIIRPVRKWSILSRVLRTRESSQLHIYNALQPFGDHIVKSSIIPAEKQQIFGYLGLGLVAIGIWWNYYPHNPYPPSVSKYLRKASWEEIKTKDYRKSILFYTDALKECIDLGYDPVDEKVTGIEIKIGEMYEKLNMKQEETDTYLKLLTKLYETINQSGDKTRDNKLLIKKDLSVLIKLIKNMEANDTVKKNILLKHINLVQEEIEISSPELDKIMKKGNETLFMNPKDKGYDSIMTNLHTFSKIFEPFKEEFIVSRDLYTDICKSSNDIDGAIYSKMITIGWMIVSDMGKEKILMSQANLGSLMYIKAGNIESLIYQLQKQGHQEKNRINIENLSKRYNNVLNMSEKYYQSVLERSSYSKISFPVGGEEDTILLQARLLSMHGLGVIKLHKGDIPSANRILMDTKALASEYNFTDFQNACDHELQTIARLSA